MLPADRHGRHRHRRHAVGEPQHGQRHAAQQRRAAGQAVETVGEIHGIGRPQQEDERERHREPRRQRVALGQRERADAQIAQEHDAADREQLAEQLHRRRQRGAVVPDAEGEDDRGAAEPGQHPRIQGRQPEQQRDRHADDHRDAAHARHRLRMHLARAGLIEHVHAPGRAHQRRNQRHRHGHGDEEGEQQVHVTGPCTLQSGT